MAHQLKKQSHRLVWSLEKGPYHVSGPISMPTDSSAGVLDTSGSFQFSSIPCDHLLPGLSMVLALQRPSSLRTGHFLLPRCPNALRLSNVPFLGGHTTPHAWPLCHLSSSSGIFWSSIFFQSPSSVLRVRFSFSTLWCMGQGQNMAPWRWSENPCWVQGSASSRA